ncbi:hypothetical protein [Klebsiella pneumoniae]|nr:hypothetical protein [Klebsiella pneumoniae]
MSLKGNFMIETSAGDVIYPFATIDGFRGNKSMVMLDVLLKNDLTDDLSPGYYQSWQFSPDWASTVNLLEQGYAFLKTQTIFADAQDV